MMAKRRAQDDLPGDPSDLDGEAGQADLLDGTGRGEAPVLDLAFDSATLSELRADVMMHALLAGLDEDRATDVVLAVHELVANAVRHGAGARRLRMWSLAKVLHCQVEDGDPLAPRQAPTYPLPIRHGHGLWLVRLVADHVRAVSGARGTCAAVTFELPSGPRSR